MENLQQPRAGFAGRKPLRNSSFCITQFLVLNTQFLVFNTQFLVFNTKFISFTHRAVHRLIAAGEPAEFIVFNTKFLVSNAHFLVVNTKFIIFTYVPTGLRDKQQSLRSQSHPWKSSCRRDLFCNCNSR